MNKLSYRGIPQHVIEAKAVRFIGRTHKDALEAAARKGVLGAPILSICKTSVCTVYYPSAELYEMAVENHTRRLAEKAALKAEHERPTAITRTRDLISAKMQKQGLSFCHPAAY